MTLQEGSLKLTIEMKNEKINKKGINETLSTLKRDILKNSKSYSKLEYQNKNDDFISNKKKKILSPFNEKEFNDKIIKKIKIKPIFNVETTRSLNGKKSTENNVINNDNNKKNNKELKIKNINLISNKEDCNNNDIYDKNNENIIESETEKNGGVEKSDKNIISQNFINNKSNFSSEIKKDKVNKYKSGEIKIIMKKVNKNEDDKKKVNNKEKNVQQSEKTTKSIMGSLIGSGIINENNNINMNIGRLITENEIDVKSQKNSVKSKDELISQSKSIKIDENEDEEGEYDEVEDDYDEKIKNDNNRKLINSLNIININNLNNINNDDNNKNTNINEYPIIKSLTITQHSTNNINNIFKMCYICEHSYSINRLFVAECKEHYLCKRCTKNYYEEIIEDGNKEILCPFIKCKAKVNIDNLRNIISQEHFKRLSNKYQETDNNLKESQNTFFFTKLKSNYNKENLQLYTKKHVIDINSNKNFFNYNSVKDGYCPFCYEESLFSKTNTHFSKCLNCLSKICRYCFKDFTERHIDMNYNEHCKVYYRLEEDDKNKKNKCLNILMQYFFVFAIFYLLFAGSFYNIKAQLIHIFKVNNNSNIIRYCFVYLFTIIFFVITVPFIFLMFPYFPSILALSDY